MALYMYTVYGNWLLIFTPFFKKGIDFPSVIQNDWKTANFVWLYIIPILQQFAISTNFVMLFQADEIFV
jgi:hypothetical protein